VILVPAFLLLVALGLLAGGLAQGSAALQWGSFAASALAALVLARGELRRRRAATADGRDAAASPAATRTEVSARAAAPAEAGLPGGATAPAPVAPADAPSAPAAPEPAREPAAPSSPEPARPSAHAAEPTGPATGSHAAGVLGPDGEPPVEEVEVTDLLLVLDLTDEVLVVDERPRYHLAGCPHLAGVDTIPLPMDEARTDGFTPCGTCAPDRNLAERERTRRAG
jgi:hypothetical protein